MYQKHVFSYGYIYKRNRNLQSKASILMIIKRMYGLRKYPYTVSYQAADQWKSVN